MASRAMRGLGEGMVQVGGLLMADTLQRSRDEAAARLRAEYGLEERKLDDAREARMDASAAGREESRGKRDDARQAAADTAADKRLDKQLTSAERIANTRQADAGKWKEITRSTTDVDGNKISETIGFFNEVTMEKRYNKLPDADDVLSVGETAKPGAVPDKPPARTNAAATATAAEPETLVQKRRRLYRQSLGDKFGRGVDAVGGLLAPRRAHTFDPNAPDPNAPNPYDQ